MIHLFTLSYDKIDSISFLYHIYHPRVFNVIRYGPDEALMYFVSVLPGVAQRIARAAHNREVTRSKRVAGIYHHIASVHQGTWATLTGVAQRKRAGLITPRS